LRRGFHHRRHFVWAPGLARRRETGGGGGRAGAVVAAAGRPVAPEELSVAQRGFEGRHSALRRREQLGVGDLGGFGGSQRGGLGR
jgi:hypothetical protein